MKRPQTCFVIPPSVFLLDERVFMSLGVLKVAAIAERLHPVDVIDLSGVVNYNDVVGNYASDHEDAVFGITVTTPQLPAVVCMVNTIRRVAPRSKIILGGPHITLVHSAYERERRHHVQGRATLSWSELELLADVLIAGDGEKAILHALVENPPKLINADDPKSHLFLRNDDLNCMPLPARHLVDVASYQYAIDGEPALSIVSQLGCPFGCGFCGGRNSPSLRRMRSRSVESVLSEMEYLWRTYGVKGFMFYDDELNVSNDLVVNLMEGVISLQEKLGVDFRLRGFIKSQLFNDQQASLMYKAGFRWILVGFESASPEMLLNMNKQSTLTQNTECVEIAKRHGLKVKALMSLGHPGESTDTAMMTHDWLIAVKPDDFDISIITVYPGTPYYDEAIHKEGNIWAYSHRGANLYSRGVDYRSVADFYKGDPNGGYESHVFTDYLSGNEIVKLRDMIEREVRCKLDIPFPSAAHAVRYEHSMGQGSMPDFILRSSDN